MDDSDITVSALLNGAAVWFILKSIEILPFAVYDIVATISRWLRNRTNPGPEPRQDSYDQKRGWMEYVISGTGFLNAGLFRQRRILLGFISTVIPLAVFAFELMSIILGKETRACRTSRDPNVVSSPSMVLFGEGERHADLLTTVKQGGYYEPRGSIRPCVSWSSSHDSVEFLSSLCAQLRNAIDHGAAAILLSLTNNPAGVSIPKRPDAAYPYDLFVYSLRSDTFENATFLGSITFDSEVVVNGKNLLYQNPSYKDELTEANKYQLIEDMRVMEYSLNVSQADIFEWGDSLWLEWEDIYGYLSGVDALVYAMLAQATREPIKTAAEMSSLNTFEDPDAVFDISCKEDFRLPRTASIIIIVLAVMIRLTLLFVRCSKSSVEFALEQSRVNPINREAMRRP